LAPLIEKIKPGFAFFLSGVDILATDKFGKLKVSVRVADQRDEFVFSLLKQYNIPCVSGDGGADILKI